MKKETIKIGIIAPSSVVPKIEFELGNETLKKAGYETEVHQTVLGEHYFYPASDEARAQSLIEFALRPDFDALWCARGGYGATHLLPFLDRAKTKLKKAKKKTLLGYSDATALLEWFRVNLGWNTIHAPMPSLRTFGILKKDEWATLDSLLKDSCLKQKSTHYTHSLSPIFIPKSFKEVSAPLVGGNLFVWNSLLGTKNAGNAKGKILFLEEIQENIPRINRMLHHLEQANGLKGVKAIVLGDFMDCNDSVPQVLRVPPPDHASREAFLRNPPADKMGFLRKVYDPKVALQYVFESLAKRTGIAIFKDCPVGHGPNFYPLFLGKKHRLLKSGKFTLS